LRELLLNLNGGSVMKKKNFLSLIPLMAAFALGASCGGGDGITGLSIPTGPEFNTTSGVFSLFSGNGGVPAMQQVKLGFSTEYSPEVTFTQEGMTQEEWLAAHNLESYDFVKDTDGYGPNWKAPAEEENQGEGGGGRT
jgi:hypothetical protein